jgi:putative transposase
MSHTRIWVHAVWSTKNREPILTSQIRSEAFPHILAKAKEMHVAIDTINGIDDHVHALVRLNTEQSIAWVMQLIKGEASHWINQNCQPSCRFQWQEEYYAVSVSESTVNRVRRYIRGQEQHHRGESSREEYARMIVAAELKKPRRIRL